LARCIAKSNAAVTLAAVRPWSQFARIGSPRPIFRSTNDPVDEATNPEVGKEPVKHDEIAAGEFFFAFAKVGKLPTAVAAAI
jgi:hypothetical protein